MTERDVGDDPPPAGSSPLSGEGDPGAPDDPCGSGFAIPPGAHELAAQVVCLYQVAYGRQPDTDGFAAHLDQLRQGMPLDALATAFVTSEEFRRRTGEEPVGAVLFRNAHGRPPCPGWPDAQADAPAMLAALVRDPAIAARVPLLPALFPDGLPLDDPAAYRLWLSQQPPPDQPSATAERDTGLPRLSLVMLLDAPRADWLEAAIASVRAQDVPGLELLLAASGPPGAVATCHAAEDRRIRLLRPLPWQQGGALFDRALASCRGDVLGVIGQHDLLHAGAGWALSRASMDADLLAADEDAMDADGQRHSPRLGACWDADSLLAAPRPGLVVMRTALVRRALGLRGRLGLPWRSGTGAPRPGRGQEAAMRGWALTLQLAGRLPGTRMRHLPVVVRSRRDPTAEPAPDVVRRHLRTTGCSVEGAQGGPVRVVYPVPALPPLVSVLVPTRDRATLLRTCAEGVLGRTDYAALEFLVLDNGSCEADTLALLDALAADPRVRILRGTGPFNWSALNNQGVRAMRGEVAVLLNNDTEVTDPGWLRELVSQALRPDVGLVGAKLLYGDRTVQHAGIVLGPHGRSTHMWRHMGGTAPGYLDQLRMTREVTAPTGACLALRRDVYQRAGGLEEGLPVTWSDVDLCLRVRALGLRVIWTPHAVLLHHEQSTRGTDATPDGRTRLAREQGWMRGRWGEALDGDPFLSPNMMPSERRALLWPTPRRTMG